MSLTLRLLVAARHAYKIERDGPLPSLTAAPNAVGYLAPPQGFRAGMDNQDGGFVATVPEGVVVSIRGTTPPNLILKTPRQVIVDWACDALAMLIKAGGAPPGFPGKVHFGFYKSFMRLWQTLGPATKAQVEAFVQTGRAPTIFITGHSKGGAICALAAWRLKLDFPAARIVVRAFAPPRIGSRTFATAYNKAITDHIRYEYDDDVVPHLPLATELADELGVPKVAAALLSIVDPGYGQVGRLRYIQSDGKIVDDTPDLVARRAAALLTRLQAGEYGRVVDCHGIDKPTAGYVRAAYPD